MTKAPWHHFLTKKLDHLPKARQTFGEAAKQVRNKLRKYRADSIVQCGLDRLREKRLRPKLEELRSYPWLTLLLVKLVLEDDSISMDRGETCPSKVFEYCLGILWDSQGSRERKDEAPGAIFRMIRSVIQPQVMFQTRPTWNFLRWPALIARLPASHVCHQLFVERFGVTPHVFMLIAYAAHVPVLNGEESIRLDDFGPIRKQLGAEVDRVLGEFTSTPRGLRFELSSRRVAAIAKGEGVRPHHELNEVPWLVNYPFLKISDEKIAAWHPAVFSLGMEQGVHRRLSERGGGYAQEFGHVFENYVVEQISEAKLEYLSEDNYWSAVGKDKNAMEAIICDGEANVLVDAKLTVYSEDVASHIHGPVVWQALKRVRSAMNQAWSVSERLRQPGLPEWACTKAHEDFLVVVTSQPMYCATGEHFRRIFRHDIFDPEKLAVRKQKTPTAEQLGYLPLSNILIASIDEWEQMMRSVAGGDIELVPFLREVATANREAATSVMLVGQLLGDKVKEKGLPSLIETTRDQLEAELMEMLGG